MPEVILNKRQRKLVNQAKFAEQRSGELKLLRDDCIVALRDEHHIPVREIARLTGFSAGHISKIRKQGESNAA